MGPLGVLKVMYVLFLFPKFQGKELGHSKMQALSETSQA